MPYDAFSYHNLNEQLIFGEKGEVVVKTETVHYQAWPWPPKPFKGFILFNNCNADPKQAPKTPEEKDIQTYRLKFHISLPEWDRDQFAEGFRIILEMLIAEGLDGFKIACINNPMSQNKNDGTWEQGKDLTIYANAVAKDCIFWITFLGHVITALVDKISPGWLTTRTTDPSPGRAADYGIPGTDYVSYRYEKEPPEDFFAKQLEIHPILMPVSQKCAKIYNREKTSDHPEHAAAAATTGGHYK